MKRIISIALVFIMVFAISCSAITSEQAADDLGKYGIMSGFPDGTLRLEQNVTRAQMAKMISTMLGTPGYVGSSSMFKDVPDAHWATQYIEYARANNIVNGFPDGTFKPDDNVTKDQVVKMVVCALEYDKYLLSYRKGENAQLYYPADYVSVANDTKMTVPGEYGDGSQSATRGFVAAVISKALDVPLPYAPTKDGYSTEMNNFHTYWQIADGKDGKEHKTLRMALGQ